jgi:hypothetical protein
VDTMKACLFVVAFESSSRPVERSLVKALSTSHRCVGICVSSTREGCNEADCVVVEKQACT